MIVAVVAVTYTMLGGISAVIWTDVIQTGILFLGAVITLVLLIGELPDGLSGTLQSLKDIGKTNPFETTLDPSKSWHNLDRCCRNVRLSRCRLRCEPDDGATHVNSEDHRRRQKGLYHDGLRRVPDICPVLWAGHPVLWLLRWQNV